MPQNINTIIFDKKTFRHSPFTTHDRVDLGNGGGSAILLYGDSEVPHTDTHVINLPAAFRGVATGPDPGPQKMLYISLSGPRENPAIDFTVNQQKVSVSAADYVCGYLDYAETLPPSELAKLEVDEHALDDTELRWSVDFFREKLRGLVDGPDEFFFQIYKGIDNAMGDQQRLLIIITRGNEGREGVAAPDPEV